jgi:hypothetical protein
LFTCLLLEKQFNNLSQIFFLQYIIGAAHLIDHQRFTDLLFIGRDPGFRQTHRAFQRTEKVFYTLNGLRGSEGFIEDPKPIIFLPALIVIAFLAGFGKRTKSRSGLIYFGCSSLQKMQTQTLSITESKHFCFRKPAKIQYSIYSCIASM